MSKEENYTHGSKELDLVKTRYKSAENTILEIMSQNRRLKQEKELEEFKIRSGYDRK